MDMMMRTAFALALACVAGCGNSAEREPARLHGVYTGTVSARIHAAGATRAPVPESGTASAVFVPIANGERLEVKANIRRAGDSGFVVTGRAGAEGWQGRGGPLRLAVDGAGRISGGGVENGHDIGFSGRVDADRMDVTVETRQLAPPGERIVFEYRLAREASPRPAARAAAVPERPRAPDTGACKRRVWKTRNVAAPGGGMVMTQVPHCVD